MPIVIIAGVILIHIAFILYTIFIFKEFKYKRATSSLALPKNISHYMAYWVIQHYF